MLARAALVSSLALASACGSYTQGGLGVRPLGESHVGLRLVGGVTAPPNILQAAQAISAELTAVYGAWYDQIDLVIEWHPYGATITGPYIQTGFVTRGERTIAVAKPIPPVSDETVAQVARVVGTFRIEQELPRPLPSKRRFTVIVMDARSGATPREVLEGAGADKPRAPIHKTSLFYEIAWRVAPLGLDEILADYIHRDVDKYSKLEAAMKATFRRLSYPVAVPPLVAAEIRSVQ